MGPWLKWPVHRQYLFSPYLSLKTCILFRSNSMPNKCLYLFTALQPNVAMWINSAQLRYKWKLLNWTLKKGIFFLLCFFFLTSFLPLKIANIRWIIKKVREFQKNIYLCFIDYAKDFDCVDHNKLWKILREMGISDHLTCLLRKLYAGQEATVRNGHGTTDWFQMRKGVHQGCILSSCLFNLYRVHHEKCWTGWSTSWNQDCWEKYQ